MYGLGGVSAFFWLIRFAPLLSFPRGNRQRWLKPRQEIYALAKLQASKRTAINLHSGN